MTEFQLAEMRRFSAGGRDFAFLVPSSSVIGLDDVTGALLEGFQNGSRDPAAVVDSLKGRFSHDDLVDGLTELHQIGAITTPERAVKIPPYKQTEAPLSTLVLNVTNKCNLSCKYCYEYGEDKLAAPAATRFMDEKTAFESVEFLLKRGASTPRLTLTFFGGETLLNFKVVRSTVEYARRRARESGKTIDFSLTTNATLLTDEVIRFLTENHVGVTISIDGPKELQDRFRVYSDGRGSYDQVLPRIKSLLANHRTRPIGARVTLTSQVMDVIRIFDHLIDVGFYEVGFAPVTTSPNTLYAIGDSGFDSMLEQFTKLAERYVEKAVKGEYLGFSNITDQLQEIHTGVTKNYACGAGLALLGVSPSGDIALCHRFVDSADHKLGNIRTGVDEQKRQEFNERTHLSTKIECHTCWVRGLCSGGCYHEAQVRYGDIGHANLHYCDWIRGWIDVCLHAYAEIAEKSPSFFDRFEERKSYASSQGYQP
ncbi:MAG: quinohemoprotein amine dehydrogenase maturation protein [Acidobacteria bacterium]|nr:quinohemoprotein amine dehydrogenase maturation protein [Acidobacteriota bacterium]